VKPRAALFGILLSACGGAAPPPSESPSNVPPAEGTPSNGAAAPEAIHASGGGTRSEISAARGEMDRAERQVAAAQGDCATACRALASMERAAEHLCALDPGEECSSARERVAAARERIRTSCGGCGP
jgi:hypothetical protein